MGSTFDDHLSGADDVVLDTFGDDVTYTPGGGSPSSIKAVVGDKETDDEVDDIGRVGQSLVNILILLDPTAGIANPAVGDSVVYDEITYKVETIVGRNATTAQLQLRHDDDLRRHSEQQYKRT